MTFPFERNQSLSQTTVAVEKLVHGAATVLQFGSGIFGGICAYEYLSLSGMSAFLAVLLAALVGAMTFGALISFTAATIKLLPKLQGDLQLIGMVLVLGGLVTFSAVSGVSNATVLGFGAGRQLDIQGELEEADHAFTTRQSVSAGLGQILPILSAGHDVAAKLRAHEETDGETGGGRGPIYSQLLSTESKLQAVSTDLSAYISNAQSLTRDGQDVLDHIRASIKDPKLDDDQKQRALEAGLTRLASIAIQLRQSMPLSSLRGVADMLTTPAMLPSYSDDPDKRRIQEETVASLRSEFAPIGAALRKAITDIEESSIPDVPVHSAQSPTAVVFAHTGELWFIIAVGFALDVLPFLAVTLIMLAHRQLADVDPARLPPPPPARGPGRPKGSTNAKRAQDTAADTSDRAESEDE